MCVVYGEDQGCPLRAIILRSHLAREAEHNPTPETCIVTQSEFSGHGISVAAEA